MSLTSALRTASSALALNGAQSAIVAKNLSGAGSVNYSRKLADVSTLASGGARLIGVDRAADPALRTALLGATSASSTSSTLLDGLTRLAQTVGDTTDNTSPAALLSAFGAALQSYASTPANASAGRAAVSAAQALTGGLNAATALVQQVRTDADAGMSASVAKITKLLDDFDKSNVAIVSGLKIGADITDAADARDAVLKNLSGELGITTVSRKDGSLALYTDGGVTLDDGGPRTVTMQATAPLSAETTGMSVYIDGVAVTGAHAPMPLRAGALAGWAQLRDTVAPRYQAQLDGIASALVDAFAETPVGSASPSLPGLFTWSGAPSLPFGSSTPGLAASIIVAASVDPARGGDVARLRDGGIAGSATVNNATGAASFGDRLSQLVDSLDRTRSFDGTGGLETSASLDGFASASVGWLQAQRQDAKSVSDTQAAFVNQTTQALSNATGVNLDDQMAQMLALENAYQASAKLLAAANTMFASLFASVSS